MTPPGTRYNNWFDRVVVSTPDFESGNLGSNPGGTYVFSTIHQVRQSTFLYSYLANLVGLKRAFNFKTGLTPYI